MTYKPEARKDGLTIREVGDELVVYDAEQQRALRLNATAAEILKQCDGTRTTEEIAAKLPGELDSTEKEQSVLLAVDDLAKADLLTMPPVSNNEELSRSRRNLIKKAAIVAFALPMVESIFTPTPAQADSGSGGGGGGGGGGLGNNSWFPYNYSGWGGSDPIFVYA